MFVTVRLFPVSVLIVNELKTPLFAVIELATNCDVRRVPVLRIFVFREFIEKTGVVIVLKVRLFPFNVFAFSIPTFMFSVETVLAVNCCIEAFPVLNCVVVKDETAS